ncbi:hypothetical protein [Candidatus Magnetobacterium casense]|uniref:DNA topoisomerase type IA zn finger domain-containing protein n=1 Tax=Candidatus Magnetobacterium casense TaxID=1455061 RepID=A0ABS6S2Z0_9BACT|nr:hypothetical protein [Candidatus Magnetobacterium casensis]MBV6343213.1 hypothetical protein [Candidatus Magnetobacterium casensis]
MDDAFIMTTAFFNLLTTPFLANGQGEDPPRKLASPPVQCTECGEPLIEMEFTRGFHLVCDNWRCRLFRQPQVCRTKNPGGDTPIQRWDARYPQRYEQYKTQKRENYRLLVENGIPPIEARAMTSNKQTRIALEGIEGQLK